jgi:SAM-dependent methyltransferase
MVNLEGIKEINKLNNDFYKHHLESFNRSREGIWQIYNEIPKYLESSCTLLDLGCGNGRLGKYLKSMYQNLKYIGLDSSGELLNLARKNVPDGEFYQEDIIQNIDIERFQPDLVTLFGVTHHVPSREFRKMYFLEIKNQLKENTILIISFWKFDSKKGVTPPYLSSYKLETGDFFLGWRNNFKYLRYCHLFSREEIEEIKKIFGNIAEISELEIDNNLYLILKIKR